MPVATAPETVAVPGPMDLVRLVTGFNLHPERGLHPSWLPAAWPARHRVPSRFGPAGQAVLAELLRRRHASPANAGSGLDFQFDSRLKRLVLMDAPTLRRLSVYVGFSVHLPLFKQRGGAGAQLRRQARRYDKDAVDFVLDRVPHLSELRMDHQPLVQRPLCAGRLAVQRGYRLLLGAAAPEGEAVLRRLQHKLPRRVSTLGVPVLQSRQLQQLHELMLLCIVPERLPQWDWLF